MWGWQCQVPARLRRLPLVLQLFPPPLFPPHPHSWGVSAEETSVIQQTCLNEIDNCRASPGEAPWFIGLRGERYGWVQPDYDPPEDYERPELFKWLHELKTREQVV